MKDKLELQKQYIEVKKKYDELSEKYWEYRILDESETQEDIAKEIKDTFIFLKSLTKQIYYER